MNKLDIMCDVVLLDKLTSVSSKLNISKLQLLSGLAMSAIIGNETEMLNLKCYKDQENPYLSQRVAGEAISYAQTLLEKLEKGNTNE